jgi:hypothetical protein
LGHSFNLCFGCRIRSLFLFLDRYYSAVEVKVWWFCSSPDIALGCFKHNFGSTLK